jgi:hypothetical protein
MNFKIRVIIPAFLLLLSSSLLPVLNTANADSPIAAITASTDPVTHLLGSVVERTSFSIRCLLSTGDLIGFQM